MVKTKGLFSSYDAIYTSLPIQVYQEGNILPSTLLSDLDILNKVCTDLSQTIENYLLAATKQKCSLNCKSKWFKQKKIKLSHNAFLNKHNYPMLNNSLMNIKCEKKDIQINCLHSATGYPRGLTRLRTSEMAAAASGYWRPEIFQRYSLIILLELVLIFFRYLPALTASRTLKITPNDCKPRSKVLFRFFLDLRLLMISYSGGDQSIFSWWKS